MLALHTGRTSDDEYIDAQGNNLWHVSTESECLQDGDAQATRVMLLCGGDLLESFATPGVWRPEQLQQIFRNHGVVVVTRPDSDLQTLLDDPVRSRS